MSHFLNKWASLTPKALKSIKQPPPIKPVTLTNLKIPEIKSMDSVSKQYSNSYSEEKKPQAAPASLVNTAPQVVAPSMALSQPMAQPPIQPAVPVIGGVFPNTSNSNYAKMAEHALLKEGISLMKSGSVTSNILNMRPRH